MSETRFDNWIPEAESAERTAEKALIRQIAALAALGTSVGKIAKELGIGTAKVKRILNKEECKVAIRKIGETALNTSLTTIRSSMQRLANKAMQVLEQHLDDGNLNAVALVLRTVDKESKLPEQVGDTSITVIMPSDKAQPITLDTTARLIKETKK